MQGLIFKECQEKEKMEPINLPRMYIYGVTRKGNKGTGKLTKDVYLRSVKKGKEGNRIINQ